MPRPISPIAMAALMAEATGQAFILLMTLSHGNEVYRCCLNTENITSRGQVFTATYFAFTFPEVADTAPQGCEITIDNVDQRFIKLLRSITTPVKVLIEVIVASQPNTVEVSLEDLVMRDVGWNVSTVTGQLRAEDMLNASFPGHIYEPRTFSGIF